MGRFFITMGQKEFLLIIRLVIVPLSDVLDFPAFLQKEHRIGAFFSIKLDLML